jgi:3-oxoacyl-[acyl-carrier protein] reductase
MTIIKHIKAPLTNGGWEIAVIDLIGTTIAVTGAARGLGRSMAWALARAGGNVMLVDCDAEALHGAADHINHEQRRTACMAVRADITRHDDCQSIMDTARAHFGPIDVLVNNARRAHRGADLPAQGNCLPLWESNPRIWQETLHVNVFGSFLLSHYLVRDMRARGWGRIINITTSLGTMQRKHNSPYGVTKAALEAATLIWAQDLSGSGVTCNSLLPGGSVDTGYDEDYVNAQPKPLLPVDIMDEAIVFLASRSADDFNGCRFVGARWANNLNPNEAARQACEQPVLRGVEEKQ